VPEGAEVKPALNKANNRVTQSGLLYDFIGRKSDLRVVYPGFHGPKWPRLPTQDPSMVEQTIVGSHKVQLCVNNASLNGHTVDSSIRVIQGRCRMHWVDEQTTAFTVHSEIGSILRRLIDHDRILSALMKYAGTLDLTILDRLRFGLEAAIGLRALRLKAITSKTQSFCSSVSRSIVKDHYQ
jgi:hypothetical protein